jgi:hypothetical protein
MLCGFGQTASGLPRIRESEDQYPPPRHCTGIQKEMAQPRIAKSARMDSARPSNLRRCTAGRHGSEGSV